MGVRFRGPPVLALVGSTVSPKLCVRHLPGEMGSAGDGDKPRGMRWLAWLQLDQLQCLQPSCTHRAAFLQPCSRDSAGLGGAFPGCRSEVWAH